MNFTGLDLGIWAAYSLLAGALAILLAARRAWRHYPAFFALSLAYPLRSVLMGWLYWIGNHEVYFYAYWLGSAVTGLLSLAVWGELFRAIFEPFDSIAGRLWARLATGGALALAVAGSVASLPQTSGHPLMSVLIGFQRYLTFLLLGCFGAVLYFSARLGLPWWHRAAGVAAGFMVYLAVHAASYWLSVPLAPRLAFVVAQGIWLHSFICPEPVAPPVSLERVRTLTQGLSESIEEIER